MVHGVTGERASRPQPSGVSPGGPCRCRVRGGGTRRAAACGRDARSPGVVACVVTLGHVFTDAREQKQSRDSENTVSQKYAPQDAIRRRSDRPPSPMASGWGSMKAMVHCVTGERASRPQPSGVSPGGSCCCRVLARRSMLLPSAWRRHETCRRLRAGRPLTNGRCMRRHSRTRLHGCAGAKAEPGFRGTPSARNTRRVTQFVAGQIDRLTDGQRLGSMEAMVHCVTGERASRPQPSGVSPGGPCCCRVLARRSMLLPSARPAVHAVADSVAAARDVPPLAGETPAHQRSLHASSLSRTSLHGCAGAKAEPGFRGTPSARNTRRSPST